LGFFSLIGILFFDWNLFIFGTPPTTTKEKRKVGLVGREAVKLGQEQMWPSVFRQAGQWWGRRSLHTSADWREQLCELPKRVQIVECGPRDGLQNERQLLPTQIKAELINRLQTAGCSIVEATSFVKPQAVPQMADAEELFPLLNRPAHVQLPCLVPNMKGLEKALALGVREISIFAAATSTFSKNNINCTTEESLQRYEPVVARALEQGLKVRGYVSTVLGCPFEGEVQPTQVLPVVQRLLKMGCYEISLGDTIGIGNPASTRNLLLALRDVVPVQQLAVHFHDTWGQALPNILTSLLHGVTIIDSSVAGLGGCPYAPAATGNVATEDVLFMLHGLGIETGIDLDGMCRIGDWISNYLGKHSRSRVALAKSRFHSNLL
jgi:isopropylmalate/homocitrate/citramalate synthase